MTVLISLGTDFDMNINNGCVAAFGGESLKSCINAPSFPRQMGRVRRTFFGLGAYR